SAFSDDLDTGNLYLLRTSPDLQRETFEHDDLTTPVATTGFPEGIFALPVTLGSTPSFVARKVTIGSRSFLRFGSTKIDIASGYGVYIPMPSWYVNFATDPNMAQTALSSANAGGTLKFAGNANAQTGLAINYDQQSKLYTALQQNFVS